MSVGGLTRRDLAAALAVGALAPWRADGARAGPAGDREVVQRLLTLERRSVLLYEQLERSEKLHGRAAAAARVFAGHERRHVDALTHALRTTGGAPPPRASETEAPRGERRELISFALAHERECIRAYYEAHATLNSPALLATAGGVMANEAQHLAVLRQLLGSTPAPVAFVTGRR